LKTLLYCLGSSSFDSATDAGAYGVAFTSAAPTSDSSGLSFCSYLSFYYLSSFPFVDWSPSSSSYFFNTYLFLIRLLRVLSFSLSTSWSVLVLFAIGFSRFLISNLTSSMGKSSSYYYTFNYESPWDASFTFSRTFIASLAPRKISKIKLCLLYLIIFNTIIYSNLNII